MKRYALRAVLPLSLCLFLGGHGHTQDRPSPEPAYLLACDDQEAVEAVHRTFLMQQWIIVAILAHTEGVSVLGPEAKQGIGGCILHSISDPITFSITGKYVYPLRLPPARFIAPDGKNGSRHAPVAPVRKPAPGKDQPEIDMG
jgi:hypothetical protein